MNPLRAFPTVLSALGLLLLSGCGTSSVIEQSHDFARLGDYMHAYHVLDMERDRQLEQDGDVDEDLQAAHEDMRRHYLLDRARRRIFQEREDDALDDLETLARVDPDYPDLKNLRKIASHKKARRIVDAADELLRQRDFQGAMKGYLESQRVVPGFALADEGMQRVRDEMARMDRRAQQQFLQAVRKVPEFRHIEVEWHAANVIRNTPDETDDKRESAEVMRRRARQETAQTLFDDATQCKNDDQFGAALVLYRSAQRLAPTLEGVDEAIAEMEHELEAVALIEKAQIAMRNGDFDAAQDELQLAYDKSVLSRATISELVMQSRKLQGKQRYQKAKDLQVMGRKQEALEAFQKLAEDWPDGLEDEQARISSLQVDVDGAKSEWQAAEEAEAAGDLEAALDHYINAERYYDKWRDGEVHIERLRKAIAERQRDAAGEGEGGGEGDDTQG